MKLKIGKKVYLQKYEVDHILQDLKRFPMELVQETFEREYDNYFYLDETTDPFEFSCIYSRPNSVDWLMEQDWIVDYIEYSKIPLRQLRKMNKSLVERRSYELDEFDKMDDHFKRSHHQEEYEKCERLAHKIESIKYLIDELEGDITFTFPKGYRGQYCRDAQNENGVKKRKPSLFKRLFGRSAQ